jgi:hypothetical protein
VSLPAELAQDAGAWDLLLIWSPQAVLVDDALRIVRLLVQD